MKISTRLALKFSIISSLIFISFGLSVYVLASRNRTNNFKEKLQKRVVITEKLFLEKESYNKEELERITNQFLHTLPQEKEELIVLKKGAVTQFKGNYSSEIKKKILKSKRNYFKEGKIEGYSRKFQVGGKDNIIIVTAYDEVGHEFLSFLKRLIILIILIGIPIIFMGGFILSENALLPITKTIESANNMSAQNLSQRLDVENANDEIGKMAFAFNSLFERLEKSFESQKAFIRNASHEIKNPLTTILGEAEVTNSKTRSTEEYQESLNTIILEAEKLNVTVNNLLQLSKVNSNPQTIIFEPVSVLQLLEEFLVEYRFVNSDARINLTIDDIISPDSQITVNKVLFISTLQNLVDNAVKFSNHKTVELSVKMINSQIELCIIDSGIGIPKSEINKIMEPFYRASNAINIKGSGIGLSLCSRIIKIHQGTLAIDSEIDRGTKITIELPMCMKF